MFSDEAGSDNCLPLRISDFSTLSKAINVLDKVLRFGQKLRHSNNTDKRAKLLLFSHMQSEIFPFALDYLKQPSNKVAPPRKAAIGLFLDKNGLMQIRGHIQNFNILPFKVKFPISLGKKSSLEETSHE